MNETWTEEDSEDFAKYGNYLVPDRQKQNAVILEILASTFLPSRARDTLEVAELGCGGGELAELLLEKIPDLRLIAFDGSQRMLETAGQRLEKFGQRVQLRQFDLEDREWRQGLDLTGCVSSLAIHHLSDSQKQQLFDDIGKCMMPGSAFVMADLIRPTRDIGWRIAAEAWDDAVRRQSKAGGCEEAYRYFRNVNWNHFSDPNPDPVDKPSGLYDQMVWLEESGFVDVDVYWMDAGHALFGGFRQNK